MTHGDIAVLGILYGVVWFIFALCMFILPDPPTKRIARHRLAIIFGGPPVVAAAGLIGAYREIRRVWAVAFPSDERE